MGVKQNLVQLETTGWYGMVMPGGPLPPSEAEWTEEFYQRIAALADPSPNGLVEMAVILGQGGPYWIPLALEARAAKLGEKKAWYNLATTLEAAGRYNEALATFETSFSMGDQKAAVAATQLCSELENYQEWEKWVGRISEPDCKAGYQAEYHRKNGDLEEQQRLLTESKDTCWECALDWLSERYQPFDIEEATRLLE